MIQKRIKRILEELALMQHPDQFILSYPNLPSTLNKVNLNYFHAEYPLGKKKALDSGKRNLGDILSPLIVEYMLKRANIDTTKKLTKTKHFYALGSIILLGYQNATIWGSGFLINPSLLRKIRHHRFFRKLDVRCVRGPYSRKLLLGLGHSCPEVYGDPAVLMPYIYQPETTKTLTYLIIPHFSTEKKLRETHPEEQILSMNTEDYQSVINKICSAQKVITSSLHGIILAETYGVPAVFYMDRPEKFDFKYADWYASTGRNSVTPFRNLSDALNATPAPLPDLSKMQEDLINSFPYDLWET